MPSLGGVRFGCVLTKAHPLEQIPGWQHIYDDRTKMSRVEKRWRTGGSRGSATLWLGTQSSLSLQLTGATGFGTSLHSLSNSFPLFLLPHYLLSLFIFFPLPTNTRTQLRLHTVIHSSCLQCHQERQIKSGFSYHSVTLELQASWITMNSVKQLSLCFASSLVTTQGAWPCHC